MKERGIIFTSESVRAIIAGRKTQTRRVIKPTVKGCIVGAYTEDLGTDSNDPGGIVEVVNVDAEDGDPIDAPPIRCPYGAPGDRLYVKETWRRPMDPDGEPLTGVEYRADASQLARDIGIGWKSSMFMPRWASRIALEVVAVRVERLHRIDEHDSIAEGIEGWVKDQRCETARDGFRVMWDSINAKRAPWASNPWVWVVEFRRLQ